MNTKALRAIGTLFLVLSIVAVPVSFGIAAFVGEFWIFTNGAGALRYSWIMWLFIPVPLVSVVMGILLHIKGKRRLSLYIVPSIAACVLFLFGSYFFIYTVTGAFSFDTKVVAEIEQRVNVDLPDDVKVSTNIGNYYTETNIKILDEDQKNSFIASMESGQSWMKKLPTSIKNSLPMTVGVGLGVYEYFMFYNETTGEYNVAPTVNGEYNCIIMAFDMDTGRLYLAYDFTVVVDN